ncbi:MAG: LysE family translocator [Gammaproteobacteria bacterium]|nr:LysE family translocator [Gammaproteobacteria bacterium]
MSIELWIVYLFAAIGLALTPGPNSLLVLTHGLRFGLRATLATVFGGMLGFISLIAASLAGLGALLQASETLFGVAKWIGALYLVYLGVRLWRARDAIPGTSLNLHSTRARGPLVLFADGYLVAASNPKGLIFFTAFLPQFMQPGVPFWQNLLVFGGTFAVVELIYEIVLAGMAQRLAPWLARHGRWFNRITGGTFIAVGGLLATSSRGG